MTTIIDDLFSKLDSAKKDRYTQESGDFCELLFVAIGKKFDREKELKVQMKGLTQAQYISMQNFLAKDIIDDIKRGLKKESSVKVIFSKILESFILKDLETFYDYNIFNDNNRMEEKKSIDNAIAYLYELKISPAFIQAEEINLKVENKLYTELKDIQDVLAKNIKKEKRAILKDNLKLNEALAEHRENYIAEEGKTLVNGRYSKSLREYYGPCLCPEYIQDISSYITDKLDIKVTLDMVPFITHSLEGLPITDKKIILKNFLSRKDDFYFLNHKILKKAANTTKIFVDVYNKNMKALGKYRYKDMTTGIEVEFDNKVMKYFEILEDKKTSRIHSIRCKLGKTYIGEENIMNYLDNSTKDNVFLVRFKQHHGVKTTDMLCSNNFGLFFLLNQSVVKDIYYEGELINKDNYILRPRGFNTIAFSEYVDNFLEMVKSDYDLSYKNKKILDLNTGFIKGKDPYIKKELAQNKKQFEEMIRQDTMLTKLFPSTLEN